jgi:bifunctional non-homologous end joining protein LigD
MYARLVHQLPEGDEWLYEIKFDGYRCLAGRDSTGVTLWSRRANDFTDQFPNIARACKRLPSGTLLDGEVVAIDQAGLISFNLLQHHRSKAQALRFYAFDMVIHRGKPLIKETLEQRRELLSALMSRVGSDSSIAFSDAFDVQSHFRGEGIWL